MSEQEVLPNPEWLYVRCQRLCYTCDEQLEMYVPFSVRHNHKEAQRLLHTMRQYLLARGIDIVPLRELQIRLGVDEANILARELQQRYCFHMTVYRLIIKGGDSPAKVAAAYGIGQQTVQAYLDDLLEANEELSVTPLLPAEPRTLPFMQPTPSPPISQPSNGHVRFESSKKGSTTLSSDLKVLMGSFGMMMALFCPREVRPKQKRSD